jgi:Tol biopolymer transport system component
MEEKMREKHFKRITTVLLAVMIALVFSAVSTLEVSAASRTIKMKTYDDVIKSGNTVYCNTSDGIYKVNAKSGKAVRLVKRNPEKSIWEMKKKGKYIYYKMTDEDTVYLYRIKITGGKAKKLYNGDSEKWIMSYVISGKKIYYTENRYESGNDKCYNKVMKLNGKSKKKTGVIAKEICKMTNKKGWSIKEKYKGKYIYSYLKTPNKTILICKTKDFFQ